MDSFCLACLCVDFFLLFSLSKKVTKKTHSTSSGRAKLRVIEKSRCQAELVEAGRMGFLCSVHVEHFDKLNVTEEHGRKIRRAMEGQRPVSRYNLKLTLFVTLI